MEKIEVKKILLVVFVGFVVTFLIVGAYIFLAGFTMHTMLSGDNESLEKAKSSFEKQLISEAKDQVELLAVQYSYEYYDAKYLDKGKKNNLDLPDYVAKQIGGELTKEGFEITTIDRDVTVIKDDIIIEGTINDMGNVEWKDTEDSDEIEDDLDSQLEKAEKNAFNSMFFVYEGKQKGTQVKSLVSAVQKSNKDNDDRKIKIKFLDKTYKESEFEDLKELIDSDQKYEVSCEENSDGIINLVKINEL